jgi:hypothetical protein
MPGLRSSGSTWREKRRWGGSRKSAPRSRGRKRCSSSGKTRPRSSTGSWSSLAFCTRTCASPSRSKRPQSVTCGERLRKRARPSTRRGSRSKVGFVSAPFRSLIRLAQDPLLVFVSSSLAFRPVDHPGEYDHPGRGCADSLQLLPTRVGGVAGCRPRGLPGG